VDGTHTAAHEHLAATEEEQEVTCRVVEAGDADAAADGVLRFPRMLPEWLSPLAAMVPMQLFCYHLARAKGLDFESPRGLRKVTLTH